MLVKKFGGSSLATIERINLVADYLNHCYQKNEKFLVVVSAMGNKNNELVTLAKQLNPSPPRREMDMLVTVGERISMALMCIALHKRDVPALSFTGSQSGIITSENHGSATIKSIKPIRIKEALENRKIPIIAGFQGVSDETKEITTLGRGGSDLSAVALASHFNADFCEIFTDVKGVYDEDPKQNSNAKKFEHLKWNQLHDLSSKGAKVMYKEAAKYAMDKRVPLKIRSSFNFEDHGTVVKD